jgi:uncharacterized protein (DUF2235 family)
MAKRIVICSDGTGNTAIVGRGTNVFKTFEAVDLNGHKHDVNLMPQIALYDDGVGTEDFKPLKIFAGITGWGLSRNVRQLYKELVRVYDPGDEIFMFGFSRGAFTIRTLAGFIGTCGILDRGRCCGNTASDLEKAVRRAYRVYRSCYRTRLAQTIIGPPSRDRGTTFKEQCSHDARITFMGVWDTVDAVGLPFHISNIINSALYRYKFPDRRLSQAVERACHALAIDDERHSFHPLLWDETTEDQDNPRIEQVWFAGAHSNVGGGYPKQGMSLVALDWMLTKAREQQLRLNADERRYFFEHANVDDKLYDPRAGLGVFYRWKIREVAAICRKNNVTPRIHSSVFERIAHGTEDYAPGNIPSDTRIAITPPDDPQDLNFVQRRALRMQAVLQSAGAPDLASVRPDMTIGFLSYYLYLLSCLGALAIAGGVRSAADMLNPGAVLTSVGSLLAGLMSSPFSTAIDVLKQLSAQPQMLGWVVSGLVTSYVMALIADTRMNAVFTRFWFEVQPVLRAALKQARDDVTGPCLPVDALEQVPHGTAAVLRT